MEKEMLNYVKEEIDKVVDDNLSICCGAEIKLGFCSDCLEHC